MMNNLLRILNEEFWLVFRVFFAPVIGAWLMLSRIVLAIQSSHEEAIVSALDHSSIPAE
jgi:hypothetical protein